MGQPLGLFGQRTLDEARCIKARRVERLQQIMARGRKKPGLGEIGLPQRFIHANELCSALGDAPLQGLVCARERLRGSHLIGDVEIGGDDAALRHGRRADFENSTHGKQMIEECLARHGKPREALLDVILGRARAEIAAQSPRPQNVLERRADPHEVLGQIEKLAVLPVPADEAHVAVEHTEAVTDLIERRLQEIPVVLQGFRGIIKKPQRRLPRDVAPS